VEYCKPKVIYDLLRQIEFFTTKMHYPSQISANYENSRKESLQTPYKSLMRNPACGNW